MEPLQQEQLKQENNSVNIASIFERAIAFVIDIMLWLTVSTWVYSTVQPHSVKIYFVLSLLAFVLYETIFTAGKLKTIGKFLLGIKVIDRHTKQNLDFGHAFLRAIGYILSIFTFFLGFAFVLFSKKRLTLEDLLAGSEVISTREKTGTEMTLISFLGTVLIIFAVYFAYSNLVFNPYKAMKQSAQEQLLKIAYLEELHKEKYGAYTNDLLRLALISGDEVQFQRDMQQYFRPNGFQIGVSKDGYYIEGFAKDNADPAKSSKVYFTK